MSNLSYTCILPDEYQNIYQIFKDSILLEMENGKVNTNKFVVFDEIVNTSALQSFSYDLVRKTLSNSQQTVILTTDLKNQQVNLSNLCSIIFQTYQHLAKEGSEQSPRIFLSGAFYDIMNKNTQQDVFNITTNYQKNNIIFQVPDDVFLQNKLKAVQALYQNNPGTFKFQIFLYLQQNVTFVINFFLFNLNKQEKVINNEININMLSQLLINRNISSQSQLFQQLQTLFKNSQFQVMHFVIEDTFDQFDDFKILQSKQYNNLTKYQTELQQLANNDNIVQICQQSVLNMMDIQKQRIFDIKQQSTYIDQQLSKLQSQKNTKQLINTLKQQLGEVKEYFKANTVLNQTQEKNLLTETLKSQFINDENTQQLYNSKIQQLEGVKNNYQFLIKQQHLLNSQQKSKLLQKQQKTLNEQKDLLESNFDVLETHQQQMETNKQFRFTKSLEKNFTSNLQSTNLDNTLGIVKVSDMNVNAQSLFDLVGNIEDLEMLIYQPQDARQINNLIIPQYLIRKLRIMSSVQIQNIFHSQSYNYEIIEKIKENKSFVKYCQRFNKKQEDNQFQENTKPSNCESNQIIQFLKKQQVLLQEIPESDLLSVMFKENYSDSKHSIIILQQCDVLDYLIYITEKRKKTKFYSDQQEQILMQQSLDKTQKKLEAELHKSKKQEFIQSMTTIKKGKDIEQSKSNRRGGLGSNSGTSSKLQNQIDKLKEKQQIHHQVKLNERIKQNQNLAKDKIHQYISQFQNVNKQVIVKLK